MILPEVTCATIPAETKVTNCEYYNSDGLCMKCITGYTGKIKFVSPLSFIYECITLDDCV